MYSDSVVELIEPSWSHDPNIPFSCHPWIHLHIELTWQSVEAPWAEDLRTQWTIFDGSVELPGYYLVNIPDRGIFFWNYLVITFLMIKKRASFSLFVGCKEWKLVARHKEKTQSSYWNLWNVLFHRFAWGFSQPLVENLPFGHSHPNHLESSADVTDVRSQVQQSNI